MRKAIWAALCAALGLVAPAWAQNPTSLNNGPRRPNFKPVNTTKNLVAPIGGQPSTGCSVTKYMPKLSLPSFLSSSKSGSSPLPQSGMVPTTPVKSPFQPMQPFTPKK